MVKKFQCNKCEFSCNKKHYFISHLIESHTQEATSDQIEFISHYIKTKDLVDKTVKIINNVPQVVFISWFSHKEYLPFFKKARYQALQSLIKNIGVPIIMITEKNFKSFENPDDPIHTGFKYLTGNHKADYVRCYLMHHYGGGYHDIKFRELSWKDEWKKFSDQDTWIVGRREKKESWIGYPPGQEELKKKFNELVTMGWVICRPNTPFTKELLDTLHKVLDKHLEMLKKHPAEIPRGYYPDRPHDLAPPNSYPLRWLELMGEISHPLMYKHKDHIAFGLPDVVHKRYK